ncbi:MAG: peptidylprolyl isomerase, partial [Synechococcaceae bacterium WB9_4xC_028]|nr:peptidylprolyl isomerase [Synechococcaceae bacterium WB9_4xC_028]
MTSTIDGALSEAALQELRRHNLLRTLVQRRVIAEAVELVELDNTLTNQAMQRFCQQNGITDQDELEAFLSDQGITADDLRWQVELPLRVQQHCHDHFRHKA